MPLGCGQADAVASGESVEASVDLLEVFEADDEQPVQGNQIKGIDEYLSEVAIS